MTLLCEAITLLLTKNVTRYPVCARIDYFCGFVLVPEEWQRTESKTAARAATAYN